MHLPAQAGDDTPADGQPVGAVPTSQQWAWQKQEMIAFIHFGMNTMTGMEGGSGQESPALFNPDSLDCSQWCRVFKDAGFQGVVLVAKHADGFCLWQTKTTEHSVGQSPWRNGKGDVIAELAAAAHKQGLPMGIYVAPHDRSSPLYGTGAAYDEFLKRQLSEVLVGYGDMSEVWFDGVSLIGSSKHQQIDWRAIFDFVYQLAPSTCIFSEIGPDVRWCGSERGYVGYPNWNMVNTNVLRQGGAYLGQLVGGDRNGTTWMPAECDVSLHRGWFYHDVDADKGKSVAQLMDIYFNTVGRGAVLLLNVPPDKHGLIPEADIRRLNEFQRARSAWFATNLAAAATTKWLYSDGHETGVEKARLLMDSDDETWVMVPRDGSGFASMEIVLEKPARVSCLGLGEYLPLGQRIRAFTLEAQVEHTWSTVTTGSSAGIKTLLRFPPVEASKFRFCFTGAISAPVLTHVGLFAGPAETIAKETR